VHAPPGIQAQVAPGALTVPQLSGGSSLAAAAWPNNAAQATTKSIATSSRSMAPSYFKMEVQFIGWY
jgi:hypothetical protein